MALFPRWSNTALGLGAALLFSGTLAVPLAAWLWIRTPYSTKQGDAPLQPIGFDHRHHVRDDGIDCLYCHASARTSSMAGIPSSELCMGCHAQVWSASPTLAPLRDSYFQDRPLVWRRVNQLPDFVHFDHSAHLAQGVTCETCHGRVDLMAQVYPEHSLTMSWCVDCHRDPAAYVARGKQAKPPLHCSGCHY
jgi:predicted CXXCH cytochrome family protein